MNYLFVGSFLQATFLPTVEIMKSLKQNLSGNMK